MGIKKLGGLVAVNFRILGFLIGFLISNNENNNEHNNGLINANFDCLQHCNLYHHFQSNNDKI